MRIELEYVMNVSSSDTKAALELLHLESCHEILPRPTLDDTWELSLSSGVGSEWFEDWPEANEAFISQDQIGGFSTNRECTNTTHKQTKAYIKFM
jgi:hypothetical protein